MALHQKTEGDEEESVGMGTFSPRQLVQGLGQSPGQSPGQAMSSGNYVFH